MVGLLLSCVCVCAKKEEHCVRNVGPVTAADAQRPTKALVALMQVIEIEWINTCSVPIAFERLWLLSERSCGA